MIVQQASRRGCDESGAPFAHRARCNATAKRVRRNVVRVPQFDACHLRAAALNVTPPVGRAQARDRMLP
jgi:hypothetical protein